MTPCTTCDATGIHPEGWLSHGGQPQEHRCPVCGGTGLTPAPILPRLADVDLGDMARTGKISEAELRVERCWRENDRPTLCTWRKGLMRAGLGPDLIDLSDPPSAFQPGTVA